jgi:hypothetical protein
MRKWKLYPRFPLKWKEKEGIWVDSLGTVTGQGGMEGEGKQKAEKMKKMIWGLRKACITALIDVWTPLKLP